MRAVLDPGVLVAALISPRGVPAQLLDRAAAAYELVASPRLIYELSDVLAREKFRRYVTLEQAAEYVAAISVSATVQPDVETPESIAPDPNDDYLVALALAAGATLVSGDSDLADLRDPPVPIMRPRQLLQELDE